MPKGLTARSFLRIYSLRDLVSTALKHTHTPHPSCSKTIHSLAAPLLGAHFSSQPSQKQQGWRVPEDRLDPRGSKQALPGIPFHVAAGSAEVGQSPGSSPKHGTDAKEMYLHRGRHVGSVPTREKWGPDQDPEPAPAFLNGLARLHSVPQTLLHPPSTLGSIR